MYRAFFDSARAKLSWAETHGKALGDYIRKVFTDPANRIGLRAERDFESGYHVFRIKAVPDLDPILMDIALLVGDVIHNLRGSLDHAFWQLALVRYAGAIPPFPRRVQFPMDDDPNVFSNRPVRKDLLPDHWDLIEMHQPYRGIDGRPDSWSGEYVHQLALLRDLSNDDKHRLAIPILLVPSMFSMFVADGTFEPGIYRLHGIDVLSPFDFASVGDVVTTELKVGRAKLSGPGAKDQIDDAGEVTPVVALTEGRPVIPTLKRLAARVSLILEDIERLVR